MLIDGIYEWNDIIITKWGGGESFLYGEARQELISSTNDQ